MIHFKIDFIFEERNYSALVQRVNGITLDFHVCVLKKGANIDNPFMINANAKKRILEYCLPPDFSDFRFVIAKSIKAFCYQNSINLFV